MSPTELNTDLKIWFPEPVIPPACQSRASPQLPVPAFNDDMSLGSESQLLIDHSLHTTTPEDHLLVDLTPQTISPKRFYSQLAKLWEGDKDGDKIEESEASSSVGSDSLEDGEIRESGSEHSQTFSKDGSDSLEDGEIYESSEYDTHQDSEDTENLTNEHRASKATQSDSSDSTQDSISFFTSHFTEPQTPSQSPDSSERLEQSSNPPWLIHSSIQLPRTSLFQDHFPPIAIHWWLDHIRYILLTSSPERVEAASKEVSKRRVDDFDLSIADLPEPEIAAMLTKLLHKVPKIEAVDSRNETGWLINPDQLWGTWKGVLEERLALMVEPIHENVVGFKFP
ncbi:hypothetical protein BT63DRAFT_415605 [Microthyrium microscopicum]|uniref:Uncharacterized protein n=1 Tax=Microthyrium microscopicum TaxID=703497 RepID=A0A6A6U9X0_9PEZI|nr:hypothetical protein BT63DRAFT_415605 [Microthyrium microscopicum]